MAKNPATVRTHLSHDMITIYVRNQLDPEKQKLNVEKVFPIINQHFNVVRRIMKKRLEKMLRHEILEIFLLTGPKGIQIFIVVLCNQN